MKSLKLFFSILILFLLIILLSICFLYFFLDPNQLKPMISEEVSKRTSYQVVMDGNLSWSFYPQFGIAVPHMQLKKSNANTMVDLHRVRISIPISQLWHNEKKMKGDIYVDTLTVMKLQINNAHLRLHWKNHVLTLDPIRASFYGGEVTGKASGSHLDALPVWTWNIKLSRVQLQTLLQDINDANRKLDLSGVAFIQLTLDTEGNDSQQWLEHLNGTGNLEVQNGIVKGINLNYLIDSADALINKKPLTLPADINQTNFNHLQANFTIKNSVAMSDDLLLTSPSFMTKGEGSLDFIHERIDLKLQVTPLDRTRIKWMVPVLVQGELQHPSVQLDVLLLKTMIAREQLEKVQKKLEDKIKDLPAKANQFFDKLLGR